MSSLFLSHLGKSHGQTPICGVKLFTGTVANEKEMDDYKQYRLHASAITFQPEEETEAQRALFSALSKSLPESRVSVFDLGV